MEAALKKAIVVAKSFHATDSENIFDGNIHELEMANAMRLSREQARDDEEDRLDGRLRNAGSASSAG
eukprot:2928508-Heterocapsa_arctica.AAC.1